MKVLYLHQYFATPESNAGTRSYEIAKRLIKKGHQVTFITTSAFLSDSYDLKSGWNFLEIEGFNLFVLHLPYSNKDSFFKRVITFLQFCFRFSFKVLSIKCDVVFATSTPLTIAIPGIIYSLFKSKPMVFEVRDLWPELPVAIGAIKNPFIIYVAKLLEKAAYMQSEKIIGLSPGMCEGIAKHNISADKIVLASNSCDTELFNVHPFIGVSYKQDKLSFVGDRKLVVYTGTLGKINDVSYIVYLAECAMSLQLNICFIVMGTGMEKNKIVTLAIGI